MKSDDYLSKPPHFMRRTDRALDEGQMRDLLNRAPSGVLATVHQGQPYLNSNLFAYAEARQAIYIHTAKVGRTRTNLEQEPRVCFNTSEMGRLLPADEALEFSVEYASVTAFGKAFTVSDPSEKSFGLQLLLDKYFPHLKPGMHYRPITDDELEQTTVIRIQIEHWSGKAKQAPPDFPGAFAYPHPPQND